MPELNEDLPQQEASGSVGGISPNLEALSAAGRGMEAAGQSIEEGGQTLYRRAAQNEVANVYADVAAAREKYTENLNNALQTGDLDTEQFAQQMKDETDKIGENLQTPQGRDFFERQQARLTGAMLLKASHVSGQIAYNNTVDNLTQATDSLANTARKDPTQLPDILDQSEEMLNSSVQNGQLPAGMEERYRKQFHSQIAYGAGLGLAEQDPGKAPDGTPNENHLTATLKNLDPSDKNDPSNINRYLFPQQIEQLQNHAKQMDNARALQETQLLANQEKQQRLLGQLWMTQNKAPILTGKMDPKMVITNPNLTLQEADAVLKMMRERSAAMEKSDPAFVNHVESQIITGQIASRDDLTKTYVANEDKMSGDDYFRLAGRIDSTPEGHQINTNIKLLYQMGDQAIRFKGVGGAYTQAGDQMNYTYRQELQQAAQNYVNSGKGTMLQFYSNHDPKDPDGPLGVLNKYRGMISPSQRAQVGAQEFMGQVNGQEPSIKYSTSPTKDIPTQGPEPTIRTKDMIQLGESIKDWKKRTGK